MQQPQGEDSWQRSGSMQPPSRAPRLHKRSTSEPLSAGIRQEFMDIGVFEISNIDEVTGFESHVFAAPAPNTGVMYATNTHYDYTSYHVYNPKQPQQHHKMGHRRSNSEPSDSLFGGAAFHQEAIKELNGPIDDDDDDEGHHLMVQKQSSADWPEVLHSISHNTSSGSPPLGAPTVDPTAIRWDDPHDTVHLPPPTESAFSHRRSDASDTTMDCSWTSRSEPTTPPEYSDNEGDQPQQPPHRRRRSQPTHMREPSPARSASSEPSTGSSTRTGGKKKHSSSRGKYRCGRCGQPKVNHVCPYVDATTRSASTQVEMGVSEIHAEKVITVKNTSEWGKAHHTAPLAYSAPPTPTGMNSYEMGMPPVPHLALSDQIPAGHMGMMPMAFQPHHIAQDLAVPAYHGFMHAPAPGYYVQQPMGYPTHQRALSAPTSPVQYDMGWGHPGSAYMPGHPFNP